jgi:hypothetical protein
MSEHIRKGLKNQPVYTKIAQIGIPKTGCFNLKILDKNITKIANKKLEA